MVGRKVFAGLFESFEKIQMKKMIVGYLIVTNQGTYIAADLRSNAHPCESKLPENFFDAVFKQQYLCFFWFSEEEASKYAVSCHDQFGPLTVKPIFIEN